jgi:DNA-binding transcriptional MerR regulator
VGRSPATAARLRRLYSATVVCEEPGVPRHLLSIGTFARRCRLSVKALRHYDELGLLRPTHVDLTSGYRWYDRRQAPAAIAIALLRSLDVPLPAIREVLARQDDAAIAGVLGRERARRAQDLARTEAALRAIDRLLRAGSVFPYAIVLREESAETLLVVERTTHPDEHVRVGMELAAELQRRLARLELAPTGPLVCIMPPASGEELILQMGAAVDDPPFGEHIVHLPPGPVAVARHVGPYEDIGLADLALHAWAEEHDIEPAGPVRERYLNDPAAVPPEALETDVVLPVSRPSDRTRETAAARR